MPFALDLRFLALFLFAFFSLFYRFPCLFVLLLEAILPFDLFPSPEEVRIACGVFGGIIGGAALVDARAGGGRARLAAGGEEKQGNQQKNEQAPAHTEIYEIPFARLLMK